MHNWEPLLKKSKSANLTFRNWSERETFKDMIVTNGKTKNESSSPYWDLMKPEYR